MEAASQTYSFPQCQGESVLAGFCMEQRKLSTSATVALAVASFVFNCK